MKTALLLLALLPSLAQAVCPIDSLTTAQKHSAFARELEPALARAGTGLQHNIMYWFDLPVLGSGIPRMGALKGWERVECPYYTDVKQAKCFATAPGEMEAAFHSLYHGRFATECAAGAQVTQLAAIHELFGTRMAKYFKPEEIFVSSWNDNYASESVTYGEQAKMDKRIPRTAELLAGMSGGVASVFDESFLDSKINRNENFVVMNTSAEGSKALNTRGLEGYRKLLREVWESSRAKDTARVDELLNDPFLRDTIIRVHPKGNWSIARHIRRLLRVNPRTPYYLALYPSAIHTDVFERWVRMKRDECSR